MLWLLIPHMLGTDTLFKMTTVSGNSGNKLLAVAMVMVSDGTLLQTQKSYSIFISLGTKWRLSIPSIIYIKAVLMKLWHKITGVWFLLRHGIYTIALYTITLYPTKYGLAKTHSWNFRPIIQFRLQFELNIWPQLKYSSKLQIHVNVQLNHTAEIFRRIFGFSIVQIFRFSLSFDSVFAAFCGNVRPKVQQKQWTRVLCQSNFSQTAV